MIKGGYILQPRVFNDSEAAKMPPVVREIWRYILIKVNHKPYKNIDRGQGFFRFADIQEDLCWYVGFRKMTYSKPQITKSLRRLREGNMIATMKATRGIIITVCKFDYYQDPKNYEGNDEGSTKEMRRKREGITKYKNDKKNDKNDNKPKAGSKFEPLKLKPDFIETKDWKDIIAHRRKQKGSNTERAYSSLIKELSKAVEGGFPIGSCIDEMVNRSWRGFKADWMPVEARQEIKPLGQTTNADLEKIRERKRILREKIHG